MMTERKQRPDVLIPQFSRAITHDRTNEHLARQWVNKGWLEHIPGTPMLIRREVAVQVLSVWRSSCTPTEFATLIGATRSWVNHAIDDGKIATIKVHKVHNVHVRRRIPRSEEQKAKALLEQSQKDVVFPDSKGWGRYSPERRRELARQAHEIAVAKGRTGGIRTPEARKAASRLWKRLHRTGRIPYMDSEQARKIARMGWSGRARKRRIAANVERTKLKKQAAILNEAEVARLKASRREHRALVQRQRRQARAQERARLKAQEVQRQNSLLEAQAREDERARKQEEKREMRRWAELLRPYRPSSPAVREAIGTRKLITLERASRVLGQSAKQLEVQPDFRQFHVGGEVFLFVSQVKVRAQRGARVNR